MRFSLSNGQNTHIMCHILQGATYSQQEDVSVFVRDQCLVKQNMCQVMYCRDSGCHPAEMIEI